MGEHIVEIKIGVGKYADGSGYRVDLRWQEPDKDGRWPTGILWLNNDIICGGGEIADLIKGLQYIQSQIEGALSTPPPEPQQ
jgi:hypothetical protein